MILFRLSALSLAVLLILYCNLSLASEKKQQTEEDTFYKKELATSFVIINDNYIANWKKDEKGNYFGADDFLTASLISRFYWHDWNAAIIYNSITSRKFNFRYDLLSMTMNKTYQFEWIKFQSGIGLALKGDLGGDDLQNGYHSLRALSRVHFPYSKEKGLAVIVDLSARWEERSILSKKDILTAIVESHLLTDFVPSRFGPAIGYQIELASFIQFEILANGRFYINKKKEYSEMARSGILTAFNLKIKTYDQLFFDIGFALFPSKNLQNEIHFPKYKHSYLPQFWLAFSWNTAWLSLRDYIDY